MLTVKVEKKNWGGRREKLTEQHGSKHWQKENRAGKRRQKRRKAIKSGFKRKNRKGVRECATLMKRREY